jgi:hypothetical protein
MSRGAVLLLVTCVAAFALQGTSAAMGPLCGVGGNCTGHGNCQEGVCYCEKGYGGAACDTCE